MLGVLRREQAKVPAVEVDAELRGCPIDTGQLVELLTATAIGRRPQLPSEAVDEVQLGSLDHDASQRFGPAVAQHQSAVAAQALFDRLFGTGFTAPGVEVELMRAYTRTSLEYMLTHPGHELRVFPNRVRNLFRHGHTGLDLGRPKLPSGEPKPFFGPLRHALIAGGADLILIPEVPFTIEDVCDVIRKRHARGKNFSIVAIAEGAISLEEAGDARAAQQKLQEAIDSEDKKARKKAKEAIRKMEAGRGDHTLKLAHQLEERTGLESRPTILGHLQRGGTPSAADRLLATRLGTACADLINEGVSGVMVAARGEGAEAMPLEKVAGRKKLVPPEHPWVVSARRVGTNLGD